MAFLSYLRDQYRDHPIIVVLGIIFGIIAILVTLYSFYNLLGEVYIAYSGYPSGTQIIIMSIFELIVIIVLVLLSTMYLSVKISESNKKE